ncbi:SRPBCC family protein [Nocardiopsis mangrovi]|uniref:SRPBCC family protein n=1 Tax=Nocardiopsis mangrovi TaxID=1179818 RepID=A0ABV9DVD9_9ACTN
MSDVMATIDVDVPVRTAYDQWTQFEEFPEYMGGVSEVVQRDDTHLSWLIDIAGQKRTFDAEITEQVPDERIAWRTTDGTTHAGVVTFHRTGPDTSRVTLQLTTVPEGAVEQLGDKLGLVQNRAKNDMRRFKDHIESRRMPSGAWRGEVPRSEP